MADLGRNAPCPCGSGKKYKKCCLLKAEPAIFYTQADRAYALEALEHFVDGPEWQDVEFEAYDEFWGDLDPDDTIVREDEVADNMSLQVFDWWLFFDSEYEPGRYVVDAFLGVTRDLPRGVRSFLTFARATMMRVYEVTEVRSGEGLTLRDAVSGDESRVRERSGSHSLHRWDIIAARVMPASTTGELVLDGGVLPLNPTRGRQVIEWLRELSAEDAMGYETPKHLYADVLPDVHRAWVEPEPLPSLVNYDGDTLVLTQVHFAVLDHNVLVSALDGTAMLEREPDHGEVSRWCWRGTGKERSEPVVFGWFSLDRERFWFDTNSTERGERGRKFVEELAGGAVRYCVTSTQEHPSTLPNDDASEPAHRAIEQYYREHYEHWLDEPIPLLDGATPRAAAASPELRSRIVQLLKELEGMYERAVAQGQPAFDPTWMWAALGLEADVDAPGPRARRNDAERDAVPSGAEPR